MQIIDVIMWLWNRFQHVVSNYSIWNYEPRHLLARNVQFIKGKFWLYQKFLTSVGVSVGSLAFVHFCAQECNFWVWYFSRKFYCIVVVDCPCKEFLILSSFVSHRQRTSSINLFQRSGLILLLLIMPCSIFAILVPIGEIVLNIEQRTKRQFYSREHFFPKR